MMGQTEVEEDFLSEVLPEEEVGAEIVLEDPRAADYQIQRIARLKKKQDEVKLFVKKQLEDLGAYLERRLSILQGEMDWRAKPLEIYVRDAYRRSGGKTKSMDLPHGKLQLRAQQEKFNYDDAKILAWTEVNPQAKRAFVKTVESIQYDKLKEFIKQGGEAVDGVTIEPSGEPTFYLKLKEDEKHPLVLERGLNVVKGGEQNAD